MLLVVEVPSPPTRSNDRFLERELYAQWRVPHYWIIDLDERRLTRLWLDGDRRCVESGTGELWLDAVNVEKIWP